MEGKIIDRAPRAHCYVCGETTIAGVCHICLRCMCEAHLPRASSPLERRLSRVLAKLGFLEFPVSEQVVHCRYCRRRAPVLLITLAVLLATTYLLWGVALVMAGNPLGFLVILVATALLAIEWIFSRRGWGGNDPSKRVSIMLSPRIDRREIAERATARISIDAKGAYAVDEISADGQIIVELSFSSADQRRVKAVLRKYKEISLKEIDFQAGFAVLNGQMGVTPIQIDPPSVQLKTGPVIPLLDSIVTVPSLTGVGGRRSNRWKFTQTYQLTRKLDQSTFPVQIVPALPPDTGCSALDLTVQWFTPFRNTDPLLVYQIEQLDLRVPAAWGAVESASNDPQVGLDPESDAESPVRLISWQRVTMRKASQEKMRHVLSVRFKDVVDPATTVSGVAKVSCRNTLSGLKGIDIFYPTGGQSRTSQADYIDTEVVVKFEINLGSSRYQDVRVVPDPKRDDDKDKKPSVTVPKVAPNASTVMALTKVLSEQDYYIQWTMENAPRTGDRASITNLYWDIGGRYYKGVYPIDFHLVLTGDETHDPGSGQPQGNTTAALTVQGAYATNGMEQEIVGVWIQLAKLVQDTLEGLQKPS